MTRKNKIKFGETIIGVIDEGYLIMTKADKSIKALSKKLGALLLPPKAKNYKKKKSCK